MVALRILVPPVRVRVLPGQRRKIVNWLVSRLAIFIFQNLAKRGGTNLRGNDMSDFGINLCFWQPYHTFSVISTLLFYHSGRPLFLSLRAHAVISASLLSFSSHSVIPATERESSGAERVVLWNPRHAGNDRTMTRESVCCHSGAPPGIRSPLRTKKEPPTIGEKEKPPLSGREGGSRERKEGEDCVSAASSAAPERGVGVRAKKPDTGRRFFLVRSSHRREE